VSAQPPASAFPSGSRRLRGGPTPQAPSRREAILDAAVELFRRRGFHPVGIDEIGTAAGISGPGVYRHFANKAALLVALFDSITERMLRAAEEIQRRDSPPSETLDELVAFHVSTAVTDRALLTVWIKDWQSLPEADQRRIRHRQVEYISVWLQALARLRPALEPDEAAAIVHAALGAINSVAFHEGGLEVEALEALLTAIAGRVLRTG
jgi:AcrR family transcriptional regulator